jgi:O-antigen/teichoic acid export membrane protein
MRAKNSIRNVLVAWIIQALVVIGGFSLRIIFVRTMNDEYLGLNGLFGNIITMLSMAELGIGAAINFSLYKPIAENNEQEIIALINLYRKLYMLVGIAILVAGAIITPFLPYMVKEMPQNVKHIYFIFYMYVVNSAVSYFFSYKAVYLYACQEAYRVNRNHGLCYCSMIFIQMAVLLLTRNFILYYSVQIAATIIENVRISQIADKCHPLLKSKKKYELSLDIKSQIKKNIVGVMGQNIGTVVISSTDTLILSKFLGIIEVAVYSNYVLIINSVNAFILQAFSAVTASVGNLCVEGTAEQKKNVFNMIYFINFWLYCFASVAFYVLFNPFIEIFFGKNYLFEMGTVFFIVLKVYCTGMRQTCITFKSAAGIYIQDVYKPYVEVAVNIIVSVALVRRYGLIGIMLGTIISSVFISTWIEAMVVFRHIFNKRPWSFLGKYVLYLVIVIAMMLATEYIASFVTVTGIAGLFLKAILVLIIPNIFITILFYRTEAFRTFKGTVKNVVAGKGV